MAAMSDDKRERRPRTLDEQFADRLRESEKSGELKAAPSYGKSLDWSGWGAESSSGPLSRTRR